MSIERGPQRSRSVTGRVLDVLKDTATILPLIVVAIAGYRWAVHRHEVSSIRVAITGAALAGALILTAILRRLILKVSLRSHARRFVRAQKQQIGDQLPFGATRRGAYFTMSALLSSSEETLFVEPTYTLTDGSRGSAAVTCVIQDQLKAATNVALLGEPGQGKSVVALRVHEALAEQFLKDSRHRALPIYLPLYILRADSTLELSGVDRHLALARFIVKNFVLSEIVDDATLYLYMKSNRIAFILDGVDELRLGRERQVRFDNPLGVLNILLGYPTVITCRSGFYDMYVANTALAQCFKEEITLRGLPFNGSAETYVHKFCKLAKSQAADEIIAEITSTPNLRELATRPLILLMVTDVLNARYTTGRGNEAAGRGPQHAWSPARIYEEYCDRWLDIERSKASVVVPRALKLRCIEAVAWSIFSQSVLAAQPYGQFELNDLLISEIDLVSAARSAIIAYTSDSGAQVTDTEDILDDLRHRTFLLRSEILEFYRFVHKSFYEFFVARYVLTYLNKRDQDCKTWVRIFGLAFPNEISDFVRDMLRDSRGIPLTRALLEANLLAAYECGIGHGDSPLMTRQQAGHLSSIVISDSGLVKLHFILENEASALVRRAIAVGLALAGIDRNPIDHYVEEMRDPHSEARSVHMGYSRVYYGDQRLGVPGWEDDGTPACQRTFSAAVQQLANPQYMNMWSMSMATLEFLITDQGRDVKPLLRNVEIKNFLNHFVMISRPELGEVFEAQRRALAKAIGVHLK